MDSTQNKNVEITVDGGSTGKPKWNNWKFKIKCQNCGIQGHKAADCRKKKIEKKALCYECQKEGHYARDCPAKTLSTGQTGLFVGMLWCADTIAKKDKVNSVLKEDGFGKYLMDTGASCWVPNRSRNEKTSVVLGRSDCPRENNGGRVVQIMYAIWMSVWLDRRACSTIDVLGGVEVTREGRKEASFPELDDGDRDFTFFEFVKSELRNFHPSIIAAASYKSIQVCE